MLAGAHASSSSHLHAGLAHCPARVPPHTASQDKACIDQKGDIDASLKVLPIFLLSSKLFVVLAGKTYTTRLWCVLEMFTFLRGGGSLDRIAVYPLDLDSTEAVTNFDIRRAECTVKQDKHRMLAIVESSFSTFDEFNAACRKIFVAKLGGFSDSSSSPATRQLKARVNTFNVRAVTVDVADARKANSEGKKPAGRADQVLPYNSVLPNPPRHPTYP